MNLLQMSLKKVFWKYASFRYRYFLWNFQVVQRSYSEEQPRDSCFSIFSLIKVELSPSKWKYFKNDKKCFKFHIKKLFCSWDVCGFSWLFGYVEKRLIEKADV